MLVVVAWVVLWLILLLIAGVVLFVLGRSAYRKAILLLSELTVASETLAQVNEQLQELSRLSEQPAVFDSPTRLRQQRFLDRGRQAGRTMTRKPSA